MDDIHLGSPLETEGVPGTLAAPDASKLFGGLDDAPGASKLFGGLDDAEDPEDPEDPEVPEVRETPEGRDIPEQSHSSANIWYSMPFLRIFWPVTGFLVGSLQKASHVSSSVPSPVRLFVSGVSGYPLQISIRSVYSGSFLLRGEPVTGFLVGSAANLSHTPPGPTWDLMTFLAS
ncbi:hypothetical protein [Chinese giant salamander iridovirus]|uniref:Uncharacterized protein n=1 Tax=Chinese giant salamander iridovirus TaxID=1213990 RepID=V5N000_FRG3V|nr:hypothetical protein [Chinese giant salamander iridovirus]